MFCRKCGMQNDDNAFRCVQCGEALQSIGAPQTVNIPNYLAQAILVTIFCCLPFGIPAIVFAAQVNGKIAAGDIAGALHTSKRAKMWTWISFGLGLAWVVLYLVYVVVFVVVLGAQAVQVQPGL